ncbi:MAG: hypothetical protein H7Y38_15995 [Armatimonadetes bacterium]|nr:hypothetical protein [Armatimonadota bacterium]
MPVVRDIYLSLLFLFGAIATLAPYLGVPLPEFVYDSGAGKSADLPGSVAVYAACLLAAIAAFVLRVLPKTEGATNAG